MPASDRPMVRLCALTATVALIAAPLGEVLAQTGDTTAASLALPELVVSATRLPTPADEVGSSVTLITAAQIASRQERSLPEVLEDVPGLNVVQTGGPGGTTSVYIRGTNSNHTKVLIDGIDVSDPSAPDGSFDFSQILASDIARVEVLRGPQSGLYGADAIGGIIDITTKSGSGPARFSGRIEGGSFDTLNETARVNGSAARFDYDFDVEHYHAGDTVVTPSGLVPPGRPVNPDAYDNVTVGTKLGAKLTDNFDVGIVARYVDTALESTSDDALGPEALRSDSDNHELFTRATAHLVLFGGIFDETLGLGYTDYRRRFLDPDDLPATPTFYRGDRVKLDWRGTIKLAPGEVLVLGAEHQLDELNDSAPVLAQETNDAGYAELQSSLGDHVYNAVSLRYDDDDRFGGKATYREAPAFLLPETDTKFHASIGGGFKPPTLDELFDSYPQYDFFANPDLKPETSVGYDVGFDQGLLAKRVRAGATFFHNDIRNLIDIDDGGTTYVNIGRATTYGGESYVTYKPTANLTLRADYTYTMANDDILKTELLRRPKHKASLTSTWHITAAFSLSGSVLCTGDQAAINRDGTQSGLTNKAYTLVDLAGSYDLGHGVSLFARIDNLLDRHYQDPLGFEHPGLGVFGGVRIALTAAELATDAKT